MTRDTGRSLTRQSLLVAGVCTVADVGSPLVNGQSIGTWQCWLLLCAVALIDAALATPARLSGVVAVLHGLACLATPLLITSGPGGIWQIAGAGTLVAGYRAGAWLRSTQAFMALTALAAGVGGSYLLAYHPRGVRLPVLVIDVVTIALLPWLVGRYTTARRAYLAELERQAELRRHDEQAAVQRAVAEERSAIARDLHDMISHHVSAIGMHAGAARLGLGAFPDDAAEHGGPQDNEAEGGGTQGGGAQGGGAQGGGAQGGGAQGGGAQGGGGADGRVYRSLAAVESSSRSAMADLRRLLAILHGEETDTARRQPGLNNLDELLDGVRAAGLTVTLTTHGLPRDLPGSLDIALYRIVQEALTNALRHGRGESVGIELEYRETEAIVTVTNRLAEPTGHRERRTSPHRGLAGIRQRVALFGGRVRYGVQPDGRHWQVQVSFPLERSCL